MKLEIKVPSVGESVTEADIDNWEKQSGDLVKKGETIVVLETDKASMEIPAEKDGLLTILKNKGEKVKVGGVIGWIDTSKSLSQESKSLSTQKDFTQELKNINLQTQAPHKTFNPNKKEEFQNTKDLSPSVRRLVETHQITSSTLTGTGRGGRLTKEDILKALKEGSNSSNEKERTQNENIHYQEKNIRKGQRREAMTRLRRKTAERLVQSQLSTASLSTFNEVDLSRIIEIRKKEQTNFIKKHGIKLGFMSFFVKSVLVALKEYPRINAFIEGNDIIYNDHQHIGIAVSTEKGLVVPVLFHAESLSLSEIEKKIIEYKEKALSRKLSPDDLFGGTFTISNGGVFGSLLSTPILNPPQSGILGMHKIEERPVAINGKVEIRPMMYLTLSYDHRMVDGRESVGFLLKVKEGLEEPTRLIMDI